MSPSPPLNSQRGTLKPQALSGTETAAPEGPALGFLLSPEVTTLGPPQAAFGVRTQRRILRPSAAQPEFPEASGGGDWARPRPRRPRSPALWTPRLPRCGPSPQWPFPRRRPSALRALRNDRGSPSTRDRHSPLPLCASLLRCFSASLFAAALLWCPPGKRESLWFCLKCHPTVPGWARTTNLSVNSRTR